MSGEKHPRQIKADRHFPRVRPPILPAALLVLLAFAGATGARAQFVVPTGYSYGAVPPSTSGPNGASNIYPDSGGELTNGVTGISFSNYTDEIAAAVWTGWANVSPTISFQFATMQTFSRIEVGAARLDSSGIGALTSVTLAGTTFTSGIVITDDGREWLVFDQSFSTTLVGGIPTLTLTLTTTSPSQWIMLDEVRFTAIPEPAETVALLSLAAASVLIVRRRKSRPTSLAA